MRTYQRASVLSFFALLRLNSEADGLSASPPQRAITHLPMPSITTPGDDCRLMDRRKAVASSFGMLVGISIIDNPVPAYASYVDPQTDPLTVTKRVYLDVQIGDASPERMTISLYGDYMPKTVDNFVQLCDNNGYAGTSFYRVLSDYNIQGGAIGDPTGKTGKSSAPDGGTLEPDNFNLKHTMTGLVSMVRSTPAGGMDSRFFIQLLDDGGWADDRYAAFGMVDDMTVARKIEKVNVKRPSNSPTVDIKIVGSGVL